MKPGLTMAALCFLYMVVALCGLVYTIAVTW